MYTRGQNGVAIILSPEFTIFYNKFGSKSQVNPQNINSVEFGRLLGLKLSITVKTSMKGDFQKKSNKMQIINLFISFIYHPTDKILQTEFNDYISSIYSIILLNDTFISGKDLNASIGKNLR